MQLAAVEYFDQYDYTLFDYFFVPLTSMFTGILPVSYTHLRAHETVLDLVCRLLLEKKKNYQTHANLDTIHRRITNI